jgi:hypothetical protein
MYEASSPRRKKTVMDTNSREGRDLTVNEEMKMETDEINRDDNFLISNLGVWPILTSPCLDNIKPTSG